MNAQTPLDPFEQRLLDGLLVLREQLPTPARIAAPTRRPIRTRTLVALALTVSVAGVIGGLVLFFGRLHGDPSPSWAHYAPLGSDVTSPGALQQQMLLAVTVPRPNGRILYAVTQRSSWAAPPVQYGVTVVPAREVEWHDLATNRSRLITYGKVWKTEVKKEMTSSIAGHTVHTSFVDYSSEVWGASDQVIPASRAPATSIPGVVTEYRQVLTGPGFVLVGKTTIGGALALQLRRPSTSGGMSVDLWIDASTLLPIREEIVEDGQLVSRTDYTLLPRTPANLAKLKLVVPRGFKHITG